MKFPLFNAKPLNLIPKILFLLVFALSIQALDDEYYTECSKPYLCGSITEIKYPFRGNDRAPYCGFGDYHVTCKKGMTYPIFGMGSQSFNVLNISRSTLTMVIAREDLFHDRCEPKFLDDTFINTTLVNYVPEDTENITLFYNCNPGVLEIVKEEEKFRCGDTNFVSLNESWSNTIWSQVREGCHTNITVQVMMENFGKFKAGTLALLDLVNGGFKVAYEFSRERMRSCKKCEDSGGICGTNTTTNNEFACFCKDGARAESYPSRGSNQRRIFVIVFATLGAVLLIVGLVFGMLRYRKKKAKPLTPTSSYGSSVVDLEKSSSYYGIQVFDYADLQEATNNFDENKELGDGGFGIVYKGKLRDGRVVAVKRLYERNFKRVGQFMNEVEILSRLRHQNLVTLYGCTSRNCRELLLVYEYVSNGTVADHLHGERAKPGSLLWTTRMRIAVETADALSFLHNKVVIHRDIKTSNILLDNNFCVKVADFGLSRLYPDNVTHVSTAPQGTPGYVDPEYHRCYRLTNKSDVYSFGVVLIELISSMPAVDITRHRHDINLSNLALDKIQNHALHEIVDPHLGFDSDFKVRTMILGVAELAFQCLQDGRDMRPSMGEVLEILKGISSENYSTSIIEELEIPGGDSMQSRSDPSTISSDSTISDKATPNTST